jgi:hypothetical protein
MERIDIIENYDSVILSFDFSKDATDTINYLMRIGEENMARKLRSASSKDWHDKMLKHNLSVIYG